MGIRKILNFGHTFAHAYEATLGYSKKLNHGEAVILGIKTAAKFSLLNNILNIKEFKLIENHLNKLNLPRNIKRLFSIKNLNKILSFMKKDKKNNTNKPSFENKSQRLGLQYINYSLMKKKLENI